MLSRSFVAPATASPEIETATRAARKKAAPPLSSSAPQSKARRFPSLGQKRPAPCATGGGLRYRLRSSADLLSAPPMRWLVKGLVPQTGLALLFGPSGAGKSFLLLDLVGSVAEGSLWFGLRTVKAPVVYLCLEGADGFANRIRAWEKATGRPFPPNVRVVAQPFDLHTDGDVEELLQGVGAFVKELPGCAPPLVVVDTLNRAMPGGDENGSADMGRSLSACSRLSQATGGTVLLAHHSGKDGERGPRGHSSLPAAADASILVTRLGQRRRWEAKKVKDGQDGVVKTFDLERVVLGVDADGDELSSCVIRADATSPAAPPGPVLSAAVKSALGSLRVALEMQGSGRAANGPVKVPTQGWRKVFYERCSAPSPSGKRNALKRSKDELVALGLLVDRGSHLEVQAAGLELLASIRS